MTVKLAFGTAGIRAKLGEADDELNPRTVRAVAEALCAYVVPQMDDAQKRGICLGFDGRRMSQTFAQVIAQVGLHRGFVVRAFEAPVPTPLLAFAARRHQAALGIMVTASHNPPEDNGIKVYWQGGAQILAPHDAAIASVLAQAQASDQAAPAIDLEQAKARGQWLVLDDLECSRYLDAVLNLFPPSAHPGLSVAYSALCGVGSTTTRALAERTGIKLCEVEAQASPRADFGGLSSPNPEHPAALAALLEFSERHGLKLAFCHDPDADRLAVIARNDAGALEILTGDEVGALLCDALLARETDPRKVAVISTWVSGGLAERIARHYGAHFERTPTGFKWITSRGRTLEVARGLRYLFGYEEAIGYCFGDLGEDKDGVLALHVLSQVAGELESRSLTLWDKLEELARRHGVFGTRQFTVSAVGMTGMAKVSTILQRLRSESPESWLGFGARSDDHLTRTPRADMLVFRSANGSRVCVRPSGTEPKLKFYLEVADVLGPHERLSEARARTQHLLSALEARVRRLT